MRFKLLILAVIVLTSGLFYCNAKRHNSEPMDYAQLGDVITAKTQDTLSRILNNTIREKGYAGSVDFCKLIAPSIISLYEGKDIKIKRTSLQIRNFENQPDKNEAKQLEYFLQLAKDGTLPPSKLVVEENGRVHYYKPITIQTLCLNCHGKPGTEVNPETFAILQQKYPADAATGYINGQLRGLWHLTFETYSEN